MTNPARDLAAAGTPGPWTAHEGDLEGGTVIDYLTTLARNRIDDGTTTGRLFLTQAPNNIDPDRGAMVVPCLTGDGPNSEANAVKIVRAVNALPAIADLLDALADSQMLEQARRYRDDPDPPNWPVEARIVAAWDAVAAALTGDAS